ncbi:MAG TPA: regulatory iron-sulfur-containing complex subunit RicT [Gemmatimonadales bacterium]|nr:regulatory iron-sulfur-containing complex subunit RicT [Gemmatimonadales bacterium]
MTSVIEVRFKGNRREYFSWPSADSSPLRLDDAVIVEVERGQDLGIVSAVGAIAAKKCERCGACGPHPPAPSPPAEKAGETTTIRNIVRPATADDRKTAADLRINEEDVRRTVRDRVRQHALPMKVSDAEWQWDKRKLTIYFTAEQRVDFRALVRDLAGVFRTRIELRQIGARDEARRLDGIGRCGRQLCISSWLPEGRPVSLSLAKAQGLSLNPVQISGPCGRLLCCLHYEHDFYVQQRKRFPKEGKTLKTSVGNERVVSIDIFRERVTLRADDGTTRVVTLDQLRV